MNEIKNLIIVNTYFHIQQLNFLDFIKEDNSIIFYGHYINKERIENILCGFKLIPLPKYSFSKKQFTNNLFHSIINTKKLIKKFNKYIDNNINIENDRKYNVIIFTEKELFNQILLAKFEKMRNLTFISVDEGIGHYRKSYKFKENIKNILYNIFSFVFLGFKFNYVVALGRDSRFDIVYLRFPELVDYKNKTKQLAIRKVNKSLIKKENTVLIFTSPLSEDNYIDAHQEKKILENICSFLLSKGFNIEIKPHPRESNKYNNTTKLKLITSDKNIYNLNINKYQYIINFGSSIVLDLYALNFKMDKIITYQIIPLKPYPLFNKTLLVCDLNQFKNIFKDNNVV